MKKLFAGCALAALATGNAYAQSTGSVEFEKKEIVVTGTRTSQVGGHTIPDTPKAKAILTQEFIAHQTPGQSINEIINQLPGVSFQNNDPFGSSGGRLNIRGFDQSRISETFDGIPLNDTGSYDIFSNQQLDPELIDQVNVNLGTTDVDSPTAAATGSTVNYRTRTPDKDFHARAQGSAGNYGYYRIFGVVDTGAVGPFGTRAWIAASNTRNNSPYNNYSQIRKTQFNAKAYQSIGSNGDFVSVAGHYNQNRNNFSGSVPLRVDTIGGRIAGSTSGNRFPLTKAERFYYINPCTRIAGVNGTAQVETTTSTSLTQTATNCGAIFDYRNNPSNTGNIRINSRFTLADGLVLTVDPSYQYTQANGGGPVAAREANYIVGTTNYGSAYIGATPYYGRDLNGDGDLLDTVLLNAPSTTRTHRYGVIASLRYTLSAQHTVRVNYSYDYGNHKQTGETAPIGLNGVPTSFPSDNPIAGSSGNVLQKRDRLSHAILHQASAEYRGEFLDDKLVATLGVRAPFFKRNLDQHCFATTATGGVSCFSGNTGGEAAYAAANPYVVNATTGLPTSGAALPQRRIFNYHKVLPNVGATYSFGPRMSAFTSYSKGLQVPGTDNLYNSFYYPQGTAQAKPQPETSDNFDLGVRYRSSRIQAQLSGWYTVFHNRLASAFDRDLNVTVYRNLGTVKKYGADGSIAYKPIEYLSLYAFGSYLKSKIQNDVDAGAFCTAANIAAGQLGCTTVGAVALFQTKGRRESAAPVYTFGGRFEGNYGPVVAGIQFKRTGPRFVNDQNLPESIGGAQIYGAKIQPYNIVDIDVRVSLEPLVHTDRTYFQLNVTNLFDKLYVGNYQGGATAAALAAGSTAPNAQIGAPRAIVGTLVVGF